jgi:hypothetical protein
MNLARRRFLHLAADSGICSLNTALRPKGFFGASIKSTP